MAENKTEKQGKRSEPSAASGSPECFVVMPLTDPDGYAGGHFQHVYDDLIVPACEKAGFCAIKANDVKETNLIHLDILQRLLDSPMCLCDLSTRNPNVLFELALRQAFDKPVALVQETNTEPIFDISPLRYAEYRKELIYHEVLEDQEALRVALQDTYQAHKEGKGINSIVRLLSLTQPAELVDSGKIDRESGLQALILAEMEQMRGELRSAVRAMQESQEEGRLSGRFLRGRDEIYANIRRLEQLLRHEGPTEDLLPEIGMRIEDSRTKLRELMSSHNVPRGTDMLMQADQRIDRIESEYRRILEKRNRLNIDRQRRA